MTPATRRLRDALHRSLANATFDIGRIEYQDARRTHTSFEGRPGDVVGRAALADILRASPEDARRARAAPVLLSPAIRSEITRSVGTILRPHLKSDMIAGSLPMPQRELAIHAPLLTPEQLKRRMD